MIENESEQDSEDEDIRIQRIKESLEDDEHHQFKKQVFSYLILFMIFGQSFIIPIITIYEAFVKYYN